MQPVPGLKADQHTPAIDANLVAGRYAEARVEADAGRKLKYSV